MHPQRLFLLYVASNSGKRYWDCKLPCVEALSRNCGASTLFMTRKWARMAALQEFAPQPGGTNDNDAHVCQPICINMYCIIIKKKLPIHWRKEWQKFQSCKFIHGQYFAKIFFHYDVIRPGMGIIVVRPPWVRCEFFAELPLVLIL